MQPDEYLYGTVTFVDAAVAGSELASDHGSGVQTLLLLDASELQEQGQVKVGGDTYTYDATTCVEDPDDTAAVESVHLTIATTASYDAGTPVVAWPLREHKTAIVQLDEPDPTNPTGQVEAVVPHKFGDRMRWPDSAGMQVSLVHRHGQWRIDEIFGQAPQVAPEYLVDGELRADLTLADGFDLYAPDGTPLAAQVATNTGDIATLEAAFGGGGGSGLLFAAFDGGLNGAPAYAFVDGGLYS